MCCSVCPFVILGTLLMQNFSKFVECAWLGVHKRKWHNGWWWWMNQRHTNYSCTLINYRTPPSCVGQHSKTHCQFRRWGWWDDDVKYLYYILCLLIHKKSLFFIDIVTHKKNVERNKMLNRFIVVMQFMERETRVKNKYT